MAAWTPNGLSSTTAHLAGSTAIRSAAWRNKSGSGFPCSTSVALKIRRVRDEEGRESLLREARLLLGLQPHPALPLVREDFFVDDEYIGQDATTASGKIRAGRQLEREITIVYTLY